MFGSACDEPLTSANDNEGPWPLIPLPEVLVSNPAGQQKSESVGASFLAEAATAAKEHDPQAWRGTLARVTYLVAIFIAMFGWMYLLWWTLSSKLSWVFG